VDVVPVHYHRSAPNLSNGTLHNSLVQITKKTRKFGTGPASILIYRSHKIPAGPRWVQIWASVCRLTQGQSRGQSSAALPGPQNNCLNIQYRYNEHIGLSCLSRYGTVRDPMRSTMGAKSIARRPPKVSNFEILELLTK
jgi:hypothetical protein